MTGKKVRRPPVASSLEENIKAMHNNAIFITESFCVINQFFGDFFLNFFYHFLINSFYET